MEANRHNSQDCNQVDRLRSEVLDATCNVLEIQTVGAADNRINQLVKVGQKLTPELVKQMVEFAGGYSVNWSKEMSWTIVQQKVNTDVSSIDLAVMWIYMAIAPNQTRMHNKLLSWLTGKVYIQPDFQSRTTRSVQQAFAVYALHLGVLSLRSAAPMSERDDSTTLQFANCVIFDCIINNDTQSASRLFRAKYGRLDIQSCSNLPAQERGLALHLLAGINAFNDRYNRAREAWRATGAAAHEANDTNMQSLTTVMEAAINDLQGANTLQFQLALWNLQRSRNCTYGLPYVILAWESGNHEAAATKLKEYEEQTGGKIPEYEIMNYRYYRFMIDVHTSSKLERSSASANSEPDEQSRQDVDRHYRLCLEDIKCHRQLAEIHLTMGKFMWSLVKLGEAVQCFNDAVASAEKASKPHLAISAYYCLVGVLFNHPFIPQYTTCPKQRSQIIRDILQKAEKQFQDLFTITATDSGCAHLDPYGKTYFNKLDVFCEWLLSSLVHKNMYESALEAAERYRGYLICQQVASQKAVTFSNLTVEDMKSTSAALQAMIVFYSVCPTLNEYNVTILIWIITPGKVYFSKKIIDSQLYSTSAGKQEKSSFLDLDTKMFPRYSDCENQEASELSYSNENAKKDYDTYWKPVEEELARDVEFNASTIKRVIIIPHKFLWRIPFASLTREGNNETRLIKSYAISYADCIGVLKLHVDASAHVQHEVAKLPRRLLLVGAPHRPGLEILDNASTECAVVMSLFRDMETIVLLDENATKENFVQQIGDAEIVHIAAHGTKKSKEGPLPGSILLGRGEAETGDLASDAISQLNLNKVGLIFLNCCFLGGGDIYHPVARFGLARSMIAAGAKFVVSTRLPAPETKDTFSFVSDFYNAYKEGCKPDVALQRAFVSRLNNNSMSFSVGQWGAFYVHWGA